MSILGATSFQSFVELIGVLIIFVFVLIITWLTTRWMANYQKGHSNNKNLNLVETVRVGNNKMVSILKAGKKYYVISVGKEEIHLLGELSEEDLDDLSFLDNAKPSSGTKESFQDLLSKFKDSLPGKKDDQ